MVDRKKEEVRRESESRGERYRVGQKSGDAAQNFDVVNVERFSTAFIVFDRLATRKSAQKIAKESD